jgi:hypothetical protein
MAQLRKIADSTARGVRPPLVGNTQTPAKLNLALSARSSPAGVKLGLTLDSVVGTSPPQRAEETIAYGQITSEFFLESSKTRTHRSERVSSAAGSCGAYHWGGSASHSARSVAVTLVICRGDFLEKAPLEEPLFFAQKNLAVRDDGVVERKPVAIRARIGSGAYRPAYEPHAGRRLKHVGRKRAALRIEFDLQIPGVRIPHSLIACVEHDHFRQHSHHHQLVSHSYLLRSRFGFCNSLGSAPL